MLFLLQDIQCLRELALSQGIDIQRNQVQDMRYRELRMALVSYNILATLRGAACVAYMGLVKLK